MPISTLKEAGKLDASTLATMALQEDQAARRARARGDLDDWRKCDAESLRLATLSRKA